MWLFCTEGFQPLKGTGRVSCVGQLYTQRNKGFEILLWEQNKVASSRKSNSNTLSVMTCLSVGKIYLKKKPTTCLLYLDLTFILCECVRISSPLPCHLPFFVKKRPQTRCFFFFSLLSARKGTFLPCGNFPLVL